MKLILLSGFLGAGKTTLLQSILEGYAQEKIGVIINEFGEMSIDSQLVNKNGLLMHELVNGSIFCACLKDKFMDSLIQMSKENITTLFVEASGLADPANMGRILAALAPKLATPFDYRGAVCVVDAENFLPLSPVLPAMGHQIAYSNDVIVNKADLVTEEILSQVMDAITAINPAARITVTSFCRVDVKALVEGMRTPNKAAEDSLNTPETRPKTFMLTAKEPLPCAQLTAFLEQVAPSAYRMKGFAQTDEGNKAISVVGTRVMLTQWEEPVAQTQIVVISAVGIKMLSVLTAGIEQYLKGRLML